MRSDTTNPKEVTEKLWTPAWFSALVLGALLFWPVGGVGLVTLTSGVEGKRQQGLLVLLSGTIGFFWGWKLLWAYLA